MTVARENFSESCTYADSSVIVVDPLKFKKVPPRVRSNGARPGRKPSPLTFVWLVLGRSPAAAHCEGFVSAVLVSGRPLPLFNTHGALTPGSVRPSVKCSVSGVTLSWTPVFRL